MDSAIDLAALTHRDFEAHVGGAFVVPDAPAPMTLELANVTPGPEPPAGGRRPFSLEFRGPTEPALAQQIVHLAHPVLGRLDIFLVPIARDLDGMRYEAVFG